MVLIFSLISNSLDFRRLFADKSTLPVYLVRYHSTGSGTFHYSPYTWVTPIGEYTYPPWGEQISALLIYAQLYNQYNLVRSRRISMQWLVIKVVRRYTKPAFRTRIVYNPSTAAQINCRGEFMFYYNWVRAYDFRQQMARSTLQIFISVSRLKVIGWRGGQRVHFTSAMYASL